LILLSYLTLAFLFLRFSVTFTNWLLNPKLPVSTISEKSLVSILIPARNEAQNIGNTLELIEKQDFENYEILVLNDNSTDETAQIVYDFTQSNPKIKLLNGKGLPKGWLGKNWACHQLAQEAKGDYFLFVDADVSIQPKLIESGIAELEKQNLTLLSIFPDQIFGTWGEKIAVPIMHYLLLTLLPLPFVRWFPQASFAAANGQFMLFKAEVYRKFQFHEQVKREVTEDIETVRFIKENGLKSGVYLGNSLVFCRMYRGYSEVVDGFSKNLLAGFGNSAIGLVGFLLMTTLAYISLLWQTPTVIYLAFTLILLTNFGLARLSNRPVWETILLHPLKMATLILIAWKSIIRKRNKNNFWKGRNIDLSE
jgi:glycosyltransferase involved in cell wall biosynthesis